MSRCRRGESGWDQGIATYWGFCRFAVFWLNMVILWILCCKCVKASICIVIVDPTVCQEAWLCSPCIQTVPFLPFHVTPNLDSSINPENLVTYVMRTRTCSAKYKRIFYSRTQATRTQGRRGDSDHRFQRAPPHNHNAQDNWGPRQFELVFWFVTVILCVDSLWLHSDLNPEKTRTRYVLQSWWAAHQYGV